MLTFAVLLAVVPADGRKCVIFDLFSELPHYSDYSDFSRTTIPEDCTLLDLQNADVNDVGAAAIGEKLKLNAGLTTLWMGHNNIGDSGAAAIGEALGVNTALVEVGLNNNPNFESSAVRQLIAGYLAKNQVIKAIVDGTATSITKAEANINGIGAIAIAKALKNNTALATLDLSNNNIGDSGAVAIGNALTVNTALATLDLSNNNIGDAGAAALGEALKDNNALAMLNLYYNDIGDAGATAIGEALKVNAALATLDIEYNRIMDTGAAAIGAALEANSVLTTLDLGGNKIGDSGATAIAGALKVNTALTTLYLNSNKIKDSGAQAIGEALKVNAAIEVLGLYNNYLGDAAAITIARALHVNTALTTMDLDSNRIGDSGATAIAEALRVNTALLELNLENNVGVSDAVQQLITGYLAKNAVVKAIVGGSAVSVSKPNAHINDFGAAAIADALKGNTALAELSLPGNAIGDIGATAVVDALKNNTALTSLDLDNNPGISSITQQLITGHVAKNAVVKAILGGDTFVEKRNAFIDDIGAAAIAAALKNNVALTNLSLSNNAIGDNGAAAIAEALMNNTALTTLSLSNNNIADTGAAAIAVALQSNTALTLLDLDGNNILCSNNGALETDGPIDGCKCTDNWSGTTCNYWRLGSTATISIGVVLAVLVLIAVVPPGVTWWRLYLKQRRGTRDDYIERRRTERAFGQAHPIAVTTMSGDVYMLEDWGHCTDLKAALTTFEASFEDTETFVLLDNNDWTNPGEGCDPVTAEIDAKYGSAYRAHLMSAGYKAHMKAVENAAPPFTDIKLTLLRNLRKVYIPDANAAQARRRSSLYLPPDLHQQGPTALRSSRLSSDIILPGRILSDDRLSRDSIQSIV